MVKNITSTRGERGQAIVLVALMALGLVALAGLAMDGAQFYQMRRRMQNAADAGAFAGAAELSQSSSRQIIASKISTYTVGRQAGSISGTGAISIGNGADRYDGVFLPSGNNVKSVAAAASDSCVRVTSAVTFSTIFIGLLGFDTFPATATAKACFGALGSSDTQLWPLLISNTYFISNGWGISVTLFNSGTNGSAFGWADFNGGNNSTTDTRDWLTSNYSGTWNISDFVSGHCDGTNNRTALFVSVGNCVDGDPGLAGGTFNSIPTLPITRTVLVYDQGNTKADGTGNNARYHVVGFARFTVVFANKQGSNSTIQGYFQQWVGPGDVCQSCANFGVTAVALSP